MVGPPAQRLILFAKRPRLGYVKTRLVPPLSASEALTLYSALLADSLGILGRQPAHRAVELCLDQPWPESRDVPETAMVTLQGPGDLGARLQRTFERNCAQAGPTDTVIIGSDAPTLPQTTIEAAFRALADGADVSIAPADDGGYVLIGLRQPQRALFQHIDWGSAAVARQTLQAAADRRLTVVQQLGWYDVDNLEGLHRLQRDAAHAPHCARALTNLVQYLRTAPD